MWILGKLPSFSSTMKKPNTTTSSTSTGTTFSSAIPVKLTTPTFSTSASTLSTFPITTTTTASTTASTTAEKLTTPSPPTTLVAESTYLQTLATMATVTAAPDVNENLQRPINMSNYKEGMFYTSVIVN